MNLKWSTDGWAVHQLSSLNPRIPAHNRDISVRREFPKRSLFKQLIMRISLIACFFTLIVMDVSSEPLNAQSISLNKSKAPLYEVIDEIRNQSGYDFFMNMELVDKANPVTIKVKNATLEDVLVKCFEGQPLTYEIIKNNTVIIKEKTAINKTNDLPNAGELGTAFLSIKGVVVDSVGKPLAGVSVLVKGTKINVVTNAEGYFEISTSQTNPTLVISYVGMVEQEIKSPSASTTLRIVLKAKPTKLDEYVVTGYSNVRKESFTGNAIKVTQEQMLKVSNRNVIEVLQVFDPSFRLERNNLMGSDPNTLPDFYIRGRSGIGNKALDKVDVSQAALTNNPNLPIFIMDGYEVPAQRVYDYDMMRIKSMTILKDAAATAIYGSRAANGVIVIETEAPIPGKLRANYNVVGQLTAPDLSSYNLMNATEKLEAERLAGFYDSPIPATLQNLKGEYIKKENQIKRGINTDWIAQPLTNMFNQKHTLTFDGGSEEFRFSLTGRYDHQNGVMKKSLRERKGVGLNVEYRIGKLQIRNDASYDAVNATNSPYGSFSDYTWKAPYDEMVGRDGKYIKNTTTWHSGGTTQLNLVNPLYEVFNTKNSSTSGYNTLANNLSFVYKVLPTLNIRGTLALTKTDNFSDNFIDPNSGRYLLNVNTDYTTIGELTTATSKSLGISTNLFANYLNTIGDHTMNFSLGINSVESRSNGISSLYTGFASGNQSSASFASKMSSSPGFTDKHTRLFGSFLALNYSFKEIYLLDVSARLDGSSEFGTEKKYAPFWSLGAGINLHRYKMFEDYDWINRARITGSLGQTGKTNFAPYAAKDSYKINQQWYRTGLGATLIGMGNEFLTWEKTDNYDVVVDLGFLKDRVTLNINWYNKVTKDLVNDVDLPLSAGFSSYKDNVGKIQNRGIEISTRVNVFQSKDVLLGVYGNFASNKNTLLDISYSLENYNKRVDAQYSNYDLQKANQDSAKKFTTAHTKYVKGGSTTSVFGMQSLGINPLNGKEVFLKKDGTITYDWEASEQVIIGNTQPKGQGSFGINMSYKRFSLFTSALYQFGAQEYNTTLLNKVENVDLYNRNTDRRVLTQRWRNPGDITTLKDIKESSFSTRPTSRFMQDYNAITINSLSISYDLDPATLKRFKMSRFRVQASTNNLATISTVKQERGLSYPFARTFDLSLNVGF